MIFKRLIQNGQHYYINSKIEFNQDSQIAYSQDDLFNVFLFSWEMTFGEMGEHRRHRSGGQVTRNNMQVFCDIFIGKLGEVAFFNLIKNRKKVNKITEIDYQCYPLGKWDSADFIVNDQYYIAIKTTKHFGHLLLLEKKDWVVREGKAVYLPNQYSLSKGVYDFLFFSRVDTNLHALLKKRNFLKDIKDLKAVLFDEIFTQISATLEVVGYVPNRGLVKMIQEKYILPQNALLNGVTKMDASNYYLQSGFFKLVPNE